MTTTRELGARAEQEAADFLRQQGLGIVERNYHCRGGEIDLIARDGSQLVFVEVRFRIDSRFGGSLASVTRQKQQRLIRAARHYLLRFQQPPACRFDVIGLQGNHSPQWIRNAFSEE